MLIFCEFNVYNSAEKNRTDLAHILPTWKFRPTNTLIKSSKPVKLKLQDDY